MKILLLLLISVSSFGQLAEEQLRVTHFSTSEVSKRKCEDCTITVVADSIHIKIDAVSSFKFKKSVESYKKTFYMLEAGGFLMVDGTFAVLSYRGRDTKFSLKNKKRYIETNQQQL